MVALIVPIECATKANVVMSAVLGVVLDREDKIAW